MPNNTMRNILFIHTDSMDGRVMGCMGHPAMRRATPNLDALAAGGVLFTNAYCNNPLCCPSRASMFAGRYAHHCEAWNNHKGLAENDPTFSDGLRAAGYDTRLLGKTDYLSGHHSLSARVTSWVRTAGIMRPVTGNKAPEILDNDERRVALKDWVCVDEACSWLHAAGANAGDRKPFFLYVGLNRPHFPFRSSRHYMRMIEDDGVVAPPLDGNVHPFLEYQRVAKNWRHGFDDEMVRLVRHVYFAMIAEADAMVGDIMAALRAVGLAGNTTVIFSSDHGEMAMEHRQVAKLSLYEPAVHVPLIIAGPHADCGRKRDHLVSLVDIYPTLMDLAGGALPAELDGRSLVPLMAGAAPRRENRVFSEIHSCACLTSGFMLRRDAWKYMAYPGHAPMLFDLRESPYEINNLAATRADVAARMDAELRGLLDYEAVAARARDYDRASFAAWRAARLAAGDYRELMGQLMSGGPGTPPAYCMPWTDADEEKIIAWLDGRSVTT